MLPLPCVPSEARRNGSAFSWVFFKYVFIPQILSEPLLCVAWCGCQVCAPLSLQPSTAAVEHFVTRVIGFGGGGLGRGLGHERGILESGMSAVIEEAPESFPLILSRVRALHMLYRIFLHLDHLGRLNFQQCVKGHGC